MHLTVEDRKAVLYAIVETVLECVKDCGTEGAPLGPMYAALMASGMSYDAFMQIISGLEGMGKIKVANHVATYVE